MENSDKIKITITNQEQEIMGLQKKINEVQLEILSKNKDLDSIEKDLNKNQEVLIKLSQYRY